MKLNSIVDENTTIEKIGSMIYMLGFCKIIDNLKWHEDENVGGYLTLKEIAEQVKFPVRVIMDYELAKKINELIDNANNNI